MSDAFLTALAPVLSFAAGLDLSKPEAAVKSLTERFPLQSEEIATIRRLFTEGVNQGNLCDREAAGTRFSRVSKSGEATNDFSIDVVQLSGAGGWHRHTSGEIDLCFSAEGEATFDGHPEGWVVFEPGSDHVPTVEGGTMNIVYLLPGGQVEWKR